MAATTLTLLLFAVLLLMALGGPWLLTQATPALVVAPRAATLALVTSGLLWITALVALGPIVAWISSGPTWLPQQAAEVCARCLSAATPFDDGFVSLGIPAIIPLALPAVGTAAIAVGLLREFFLLKRSRAKLREYLLRTHKQMTLLGYRVRVAAEATPYAFSAPSRRGGIVVSQGALSVLTTAELAAVLEHEQAHLNQRHHLYLAIMNGTTRYFRWVPFVTAVRTAVPHYLEIAADRAAARLTGTPALASALLKLGEKKPLPCDSRTTGRDAAGSPTEHSSQQPVSAVVLQAAGSERIKFLVGHPRPPASAALAAAASVCAVMLAATIAAVHWPYVLAIATGC